MLMELIKWVLNLENILFYLSLYYYYLNLLEIFENYKELYDFILFCWNRVWIYVLVLYMIMKNSLM